MNTQPKILLTAALCAAIATQSGRAQSPPEVILQIDIENRVQYFEDTSDISKFGTNPALTTTPPPQDFSGVIEVADIVAINGQPIRGTVANVVRSIFLRPAPTPGQAIADTTRNAVNQYTLEILKLDGTPIGTLLGSGVGVGTAPPGAPLGVLQSNAAIVGGTGAFLGMRGQLGAGTAIVATRQASITEDPSNRRVNGGGKGSYIVHLIPMSRPEIANGAGGPSIFHADFSPVTVAKPAKTGEVLIVRATGLGPTVPGVNPGQPFSTATPPVVNSPLAVTVNDKPADVINGIGWPGLVNTYRVDFRVPDGLAPGTASVQLTTAWIQGTAVPIPVQ